MDVTAVDLLLIASAALVGILSVARLTRLLVMDSWPPVVALREWWDRRTMVKDGPNKGEEGDWYALVTCPYCAAPYIAAVILGWAVITDLHWTWWIFNGWLAVAYLASMIVAKDGE